MSDATKQEVRGTFTFKYSYVLRDREDSPFPLQKSSGKGSTGLTPRGTHFADEKSKRSIERMLSRPAQKRGAHSTEIKIEVQAQDGEGNPVEPEGDVKEVIETVRGELDKAPKPEGGISYKL